MRLMIIWIVREMCLIVIDDGDDDGENVLEQAAD